MGEIDSRRQAFRNAMARLAAAVNVVVTNGPAGRCGLTATAVCSVSDDPPTLLVCINRDSALNAVFKTNGVVGVNVLSHEHEQTAKVFAGMTGVPMEERFDRAHWIEDVEAGLPVLRGALATLEGRVSQVAEVGTHSVLFIEIERIDTGPAGDALVYFERSFLSPQPIVLAA